MSCAQCPRQVRARARLLAIIVCARVCVRAHSFVFWCVYDQDDPSLTRDIQAGSLAGRRIRARKKSRRLTTLSSRGSRSRRVHHSSCLLDRSLSLSLCALSVFLSGPLSVYEIFSRARAHVQLIHTSEAAGAASPGAGASICAV